MRFLLFVFIVALVGCHRRPAVEEDSPSCPPISCPSAAPVVEQHAPYELEVYKTLLQTKEMLLTKCTEDLNQAVKDRDDALKDADEYKESYYNERNQFQCDCN
jgi:hypothetical protein